VQINQATVDLVKEFEGLRLTAYRDAVGVWTIGYGTTAAAGVGIRPEAGMRITEDEAETYLRRGLEKFAAQIAPHIRVPVTDNQFGALVSLAYNVGAPAVIKSTLLRKLNAGDYIGASAEFARWNKAGGKVLAGLTRRRAAERKLFDADTAAFNDGVGAILKPNGAAWRDLFNAIMSLFRGRK